MEFKYNGSFNLEHTVNLRDIIESGQTFLWERKNSEMFSSRDLENIIYKTAYVKKDGDVVAVELEQDDKKTIKWRSNYNESNYISQRLGLDHKIERIKMNILDKDQKELIRDSVNNYNGMRLVNEPLYPTIISFICSTQMRIERINNMISNICQKYGKNIEIDGTDYNAFPCLEKLSTVSESDLKDQKLGYRAKYVSKTSEMLFENRDILDLPDENHKARSELENLMGVGTKVADCTLLYGTERLNVVPVDTWIEKLAKKYYKEIYSDKRSEIARDMETYFGKYSGYAQLYLFRYIQNME